MSAEDDERRAGRASDRRVTAEARPGDQAGRKEPEESRLHQIAEAADPGARVSTPPRGRTTRPGSAGSRHPYPMSIGIGTLVLIVIIVLLVLFLRRH